MNLKDKWILNMYEKNSIVEIFVLCFSINILEQLVKHNWYSYLSHYLMSIDLNEFDQIEKILMALIPLTDACRDDFVSLLPILDKLNDVYSRHNLNEYSTYINVLTNLQTLRRTLSQAAETDL